MARPKIHNKKIAYAVTLTQTDAITFSTIGEGNMSKGMADLLMIARQAGLIDSKKIKEIKKAVEAESKIFD